MTDIPTLIQRCPGTARPAIALLLALSLLAASSAIASGPDQTNRRPNWMITTEAEYGHVFRTDLKEGDGSFNLHEAGVGLSFGKMLPDLNGILSFKLECGLLDFDLYANGNNLFNEAGLFDKVVETTAGLNLILNRDEWSYIGLLSAGTACEDHASVEDSLRIQGVFGVMYRFSDQLQLGFGLFAGTRLEDDVLVIPYISAEYKPTDRLTLAVRNGLFAEYVLEKDRTSLIFEGKYDSHVFRLDKTEPTPNGVVDYSRVPIKVGIRHKFSRNLAVTSSIGAVVWHEFEMTDDDGDEIGDTEAHPAAVFNLAVRFGL